MLRIKSLKIHITLTFVLLLGIGMLLVNVVALSLWRRQAIEDEITSSKALLVPFGNFLAEKNLAQGDNVDAASLLTDFFEDGCFGFYLAGELGAVQTSECRSPFDEQFEHILTVTLTTGETRSLIAGPPGQISTIKNEKLFVALPLTIGKEIHGAIGLVRPLYPMHEKLWENEKIILVYVLANIIILAIVGFFRVAHLVMRPIERLAEQADNYPGHSELLPFLRQGGSEFGRLESSLNQMIGQIEKDRESLRQTVQSLEQANVQLENTRLEMVQAEKMASIGRLSAGLAHEIGNPLGILQGYLELLGHGGLTDTEQKELLARSGQELGRVHRLIRQLLDFSRPPQQSRSLLQVRAILAEVVEMFRNRKQGKGITYVEEFNAGDKLVMADSDGLRQVFVNCLLNAEDAILAGNDAAVGGRIVVSCLEQAASDSPSLLVKINDNGTGIAKEKLANVFEPFFTTKEPGEGTGLGLSVSFGIIKGFGGTMGAESTPENGTTLWIRLPLSGDGRGGECEFVSQGEEQNKR